MYRFFILIYKLCRYIKIVFSFVFSRWRRACIYVYIWIWTKPFICIIQYISVFCSLVSAVPEFNFAQFYWSYNTGVVPISNFQRPAGWLGSVHTNNNNNTLCYDFHAVNFFKTRILFVHSNCQQLLQMECNRCINCLWRCIQKRPTGEKYLYLFRKACSSTL